MQSIEQQPSILQPTMQKGCLSIFESRSPAVISARQLAKKMSNVEAVVTNCWKEMKSPWKNGLWQTGLSLESRVSHQESIKEIPGQNEPEQKLRFTYLIEADCPTPKPPSINNLALSYHYPLEIRSQEHLKRLNPETIDFFMKITSSCELAFQQLEEYLVSFGLEVQKHQDHTYTISDESSILIVLQIIKNNYSIDEHLNEAYDFLKDRAAKKLELEKLSQSSGKGFCFFCLE